MIVCQTDGNFDRPFKAKRGVTQGSPLSPKLFNILVDAVMWECWKRLDGTWDGIKGFCWAVEGFIALFYANDGLVASR